MDESHRRVGGQRGGVLRGGVGSDTVNKKIPRRACEVFTCSAGRVVQAFHPVCVRKVDLKMSGVRRGSQAAQRGSTWENQIRIRAALKSFRSLERT